MADLRVTIAGVEFKNPVIMASGMFGYGREYEKMYSLSRLGGISCRQDAAEMLIAGAKAVQIGSILFSNPYAPLNIIDGLTNYLERENIDSIEKLCASGELW